MKPTNSAVEIRMPRRQRSRRSNGIADQGLRRESDAIRTRTYILQFRVRAANRNGRSQSVATTTLGESMMLAKELATSKANGRGTDPYLKPNVSKRSEQSRQLRTRRRPSLCARS